MSNKRTETQGYIYFISKGTDSVKIGFTKAREGKTKEDCVLIRLKQLQVASDRPLKILYILEGTMDTERYYLHNYFQTCKLSGEWFDYKAITQWIKTDRLNKEEQRKLGYIK